MNIVSLKCCQRLCLVHETGSKQWNFSLIQIPKMRKNKQQQTTKNKKTPPMKWREVNETLFLQSCFIACQENIFRRWTEKEKTFVVSIWATADLWVLLVFSDIKSKLCERWWRCSNRNGEWKWANIRSCSIKTQNDNQNKWDYQCTSRRKSTRNICSGEVEIKRIIRFWSCAFGKSLWKIW